MRLRMRDGGAGRLFGVGRFRTSKGEAFVDVASLTCGLPEANSPLRDGE
jgi:hypothetical protein